MSPQAREHRETPSRGTTDSQKKVAEEYWRKYFLAKRKMRLENIKYQIRHILVNHILVSNEPFLYDNDDRLFSELRQNYTGRIML